MIISFENEKLRSIFEKENFAMDYFGNDIVDTFLSKVADIESIETLNEAIEEGIVSQLPTDENNYFALRITENVRITLQPIPPSTADYLVNRIKIVSIDNI